MSGARRRLAAILAADVAGYSRLMGDDEAATVAMLNTCRDVFRRRIEDHSGRVVDTAGDSVLAAFDSVVNAAECAVEVQSDIAAKNAELADERQMLFRIGINSGDVIEQADGTIYGDGVNVAARLETLAEPGGICFSASAHDQVEGKLDLVFEDIGEQAVKNIARPVRAYRVNPAGEPSGPMKARAKSEIQRASIAVLPFENLSDDPDQEYFADGISEDLITALSRVRWLLVTARNSSFSYKGKSPDIRDVGRRLGVRYVLEGSVRKGGNRVRITAQLIDGSDGTHIWAHRYDRELEDVFEVQDEITQNIAAAVESELSEYERLRAVRKNTNNLDAWDLFQKGVSHSLRQDRENIEAGLNLMRQAVQLDPEFGQPYGYLAFFSYSLLRFGWAEDREETLRQGLANARKAIAIDQRDYFAHFALGRMYEISGDFPAAIRALNNSVRLNHSFAHGYYGLASVYVSAGNGEAARTNAEIAIRLSPNDPMLWAMQALNGMAHWLLKDLETAIDFLQQAGEHPHVQYIVFVWLANLLTEVGREEDAKRALSKALSLEPRLSLLFLRNLFPKKAGARTKQLLNNMKQIGLSEG